MVYVNSKCTKVHDTTGGHQCVDLLVPLPCVVGEKLVIKLADFGLARDIHGKDCYRIGGKATLPVKWMAPESLLYGEFSQATDVW